MMLRLLFAGALVGLPFLVSGALAQSAAIPAGSSTSSAAPAAPSGGTTSAAPPAIAPAPSDGSASPFLPAPNVATPPAIGVATPPAPSVATPPAPSASTPPAASAGSTPSNPPPAAAPASASGEATAPPKPKKVAPPPPPRETALSDDPEPTLQPDTFFATAKASERYSAIVDAGGWPTDIVAIGPGTKGPAVLNLRKRLAIEGDLDAKQASGLTWDAGLTAAVKRFQSRMGLRQTGVVAGATLKAINVPASVRFNQLASSANRLAGLNFSFDDRYVVVNLPSTSVEAVENGHVVHRYVAIVGDPEHPSPEISAHIQVINLNPTWTVPVSIIKKEIIPRMQRDPGYLTRAKIRILDGSGQEINPRTVNWSTERAADYTLRQDSGAGNSLGSIRIGMPNKLAVYMHDTPSKGLFGADYRFLSHGCVRVQGVYDYAEWLLHGTGGGPDGAWDKAALQAKIKEGAAFDIKLTKAVPVIWVYLTGWSNGDGPAKFRDDVYAIDTVGEAQANAVQASPLR
jgi:murein L,D-transpeptidase YcbB/YkuD